MNNNTAKNRGGALFLNGPRSPIEMLAKSQLLLRRNKVLSTAGKGGAIFVHDTKKSCHSDCESLEIECFFVYSSNSTLVFDRNVATFGSILYGGLMDRCSLNAPETDLLGIDYFRQH